MAYTIDHMAGRYRKSQEGSRSRFYLFLSVIFIFVMIKWGFPLFIKIIAGKGVVISNNVEDVIPPQPPTLAATPEATNEATITVEGFTEQGAELELMINDTLNKTDKAKEDGSFIFIASLTKGQNRVQVRAKDSAGNASLSEVKLVLVDQEPVILTINSPKDGTEFIGKNSQTLEITGKTNKMNAQVIANNSFVDVNRDGTFTHRLQLNSGENTIKIVASDKAGNLDEQTIKVTYTP